jgi:hypothetical protein
MMNISPAEAEEALAAIEVIANKTREAISKSGAYAFLIIWGSVWFLGFLANHFLSGDLIGYIWFGLDILGGLTSAVFGARMNLRVRSPSTTASSKRIAWFWLLLFLFCVAAIGILWPLESNQLAMIIILFVMVGWMAMGLLLRFSSIGWGLVITGLSLIGYFFLPSIFNLWMAILGGGGMIALGLYIRNKW